MASRTEASRNNQGSKKQRSPKPATRNLDTLARQQRHPATLIQRAQLDPELLTPGEVLHLQRTIGNRAVGQLLAQDQQAAPRPGQSNDLGPGVDLLSGDAVAKEPAAKETRPDTVQRAGGLGDKIGTLLKLKDWSSPVAPVAPSDIQFTSVSNGDKVGSIYFPTNRIRLIHRSGPQVSPEHPGIKRYAIPPAEYQLYRNWKKKYIVNTGHRPKFSKNKNQVENVLKCPEARPGVNGKLVEFWPEKGSHPSRGEPKAFTWDLTQEKLNKIYNAAKTGSNWILGKVMKRDPDLKHIPMNDPP